MNLRDTTDFGAALRFAATSLNVPERQLEKDYWVTQTLRALFREHPGTMLFKGGTSLSKAWRLIHRFSEDIDLLLLSRPGDATDELIDKMTATASSVCSSVPTVQHETTGFARVITVPYPMAPNTAKAPGMRKEILLEPGVRGGPRPHTTMKIGTLLADGLEAGVAGEYDDLDTCDVDVLHPARTFVEKLFAAERIAHYLKAEPNKPIKGTEARHFYDLYFLADPSGPAIQYLSEPNRYEEIVRDCEKVSHRWFPDRLHSRPSAGFARSAAFNDASIVQRLALVYEPWKTFATRTQFGRHLNKLRTV